MPVTAVDLGTVTACRTQRHRAASPSLSLALSASCAIDVPSEFPLGSLNINLQPSHIARACKEGTLWVFKAGSCRLDFAALLVDNEGEFLDASTNKPIDETTLTRISGSVADFQIWQDLGLRLRDRHSDDSESNSDITAWEEKDSRFQASSSSFFLHHPDLSSDIHAPPSIPCARFHGLTCQIKLCFIKDAHHTTADTRRRGEKNHNEPRLPKETNAESEPEQKVEGKEEKTKGRIGRRSHHFTHDHGYNRRRRACPTRKTIGEVVDVEDLGAGEVLGNPPLSAPAAGREGSSRIHEAKEGIAGGGEMEGYFTAKTVPQQAALSSSSVDIAREVEELLDAALKGLVGVGKKGLKGIRVVREVGRPSLIELAPAVWNMRYLQFVTAHAQLIPSMANSLARLGNSRSASLREKLARITDKQQSGQDDTVNELTQRLWRLCQTGIRARPIFRGYASQTEIMREVVFHPRAASPNSFEHQETQRMTYVPYLDEYSEYIFRPGAGMYGSFAGQMPVESSQEGMYDVDGDDDDRGSDVWQAEWLGPHDSEIYDESDDGTESGFYSATCSEMNESGGSQSDETSAGEEEPSVGEYFYADGQGNVFPIGVGDDEESGDDHHYQGSSDSDREDSVSFVTDDREERSEDSMSDEYEYLAVEQYPDQQNLWHAYQEITVGSSVDIGHW